MFPTLFEGLWPKTPTTLQPPPPSPSQDAEGASDTAPTSPSQSTAGATDVTEATDAAPSDPAVTMDMLSSSSPLSSPAASSPMSSPLSVFSSTPSLPSLPGSPTMADDPSQRYLSPASTSTMSGTQSPIKLGHSMPARSDDGPPAKKRKITQPKERTTEYLDLTKPNEQFSPEDGHQMERLLQTLRKKKKIVVIAGAGISVSAGIPDFRSSTGLFATARTQHKLKASGKHLFDASVYKHDASTQSFHTMVREMDEMTKKAKPTPFHHLLASLAQEGRLLRLYSQNIDCIDTSMEPLATSVPLNLKGPWPTTVQLHGGLQKMVCTKCGELKPFQAELFDGPEAPTCHACELDDQVRTNHAGKRSHGIGRLRPRFVLYNEYNPDEEAIGNVSSADLKARPDAVIVVGTTLKVPGTRRLVKELCQVARGRRNGFTAWINVEDEPKGVDFKDCWDLVVRSSCDNVARLAELPPWDCQIGDDYMVSKEQDVLHNESRSKTTIQVDIRSSSVSSIPSPQSQLEVHLEAKPRLLEDVQGIPTPGPSPKISAVKQVGNTKQSKIAFGTTAGSKNPVKTVKPKARKRKQPAKAEPPKNTVMGSFKAAKNIANREIVKKLDSGPLGKSPLVKAESLQENLPLKEDPADLASLPALRPQRQSSTDNFHYVCETSDDKAGPPTTPTFPEREIPRDTISPKSKPQGMQALID